MRWVLPAFLLLFSFAACAQTPTISFVANNFSDQKGFSPGVLVNIFGSNLGPAAFTRGPVAGLQIEVGGKVGAVLTASVGQLNVQFPTDVVPGPANLIVEYEGRKSAPFALRIEAFSPAIAVRGSGRDGEQGQFSRLNGNSINSQNPAVPGDVLRLIATGLGPTNPAVAAGAISPSAATTITTPKLTVGSRAVPLLFSGLAPGFTGFYYLIFSIPGDLTSGSHAVQIDSGGVLSNIATLPVAVKGLLLTQSGVTIQAVQSGATPPARTVGLINGSTSDVNFTASTTLFSGTSDWLSVTPQAGTARAGGTPTNLTLQANATGFAVGDYYGQIRIDAPGAPNTPLFISVVLTVAGANVNPGAVVEPTGLVFLGAPGGSNPPAQTVRMTSLTSRPAPFTAAVIGGDSGVFLLSPQSDTLAPGTPATIRVTPNLSGRAAGTYRRQLAITFTQDNIMRLVDLLLIVAQPVAPGSAAIGLEHLFAPEATRSADNCAPTKLLPVFTQLGAGFNASVAWPAPLELIIVDDCGTPMVTGGVDAAFSNNDPPRSLSLTGSGRWSGTWVPLNRSTAAVKVTVKARIPEAKLEGSAELSGNVKDNDDVPQLNPNGVVSAGSFSLVASPSPGELVAIFGRNLAASVQFADSLPFPARLQDVQVILAGRSLPLVAVTPGQINAVIPYDLQEATTHQMIIRRGNRVAVPEPVPIMPAQPSIFTLNLLGSGQGHIYVAGADGQQTLAGKDAPAKAGDILVMYATGLGKVAPPIQAGSVAPTDVLRRVDQALQVTIDSKAARVLFAGLSPGSAGLYQINAEVPAGVESNDAAQVVVTVAGVNSAAVTMAVR